MSYLQEKKQTINFKEEIKQQAMKNKLIELRKKKWVETTSEAAIKSKQTNKQKANKAKRGMVNRPEKNTKWKKYNNEWRRRSSKWFNWCFERGKFNKCNKKFKDTIFSLNKIFKLQIRHTMPRKNQFEDLFCEISLLKNKENAIGTMFLKLFALSPPTLRKINSL